MATETTDRGTVAPTGAGPRLRQRPQTASGHSYWVQGADRQVLSLEASDPFSWEKGLCGKYKQPKVTHTLPFVTSH